MVLYLSFEIDEGSARHCVTLPRHGIPHIGISLRERRITHLLSVASVLKGIAQARPWSDSIWLCSRRRAQAANLCLGPFPGSIIVPLLILASAYRRKSATKPDAEVIMMALQ